MADFLTALAGTQPDKVAVIEDRPDGRVLTWSFAELEAEANRLANVLIGLGAGPGTKVVWCGPNSPGIVRAMHACRKAGVTAVPLNYRLSDEEMAYVVDNCDAAVVVVDAEYAAALARVRPETPKVAHVLVFDGPALEGQEALEPLLAAADPTAPEDRSGGLPGSSTMIYTSGTTGRPKGAVRRSGVGSTATAAMVTHIGYRPDDVYLTTGPLYHSGPGNFMMIGATLGQTVVTQRKFDPEDWLRLVATHRCSSTFSAPTPIRMVCSLPAEVKARYDTSSMRVMIANAAPWSFALKQLYLADFPAHSLWEVYGSTELGVNCILRPEDQLRKPGSCGTAAPQVEIVLFDDDGNEVTGTGPEATGELFVRSPSVFATYYKAEEKFLADRRGDWQTVGDIAYRDDEGYFYICDRKKDMVISGGMNIYPAEIEGALEHHPDIVEASVFGIPDEQWGEAVHAVVVRRAGAALDADGVIGFARDHLASYKIPRSVTFADELPKTGSGKVLKRELRAPFWAGYSRQVG